MSVCTASRVKSLAANIAALRNALNNKTGKASTAVGPVMDITTGETLIKGGDKAARDAP